MGAKFAEQVDVVENADAALGPVGLHVRVIKALVASAQDFGLAGDGRRYDRIVVRIVRHSAAGCRCRRIHE